MGAIHRPCDMPILPPRDIQVSLEIYVQRSGSLSCLHERCRDRIDAILSALPPQHLSVGPNDNPLMRNRDTKTWTNILDVVRTYEIRLAKVGPFRKQSIERTKCALRWVVIAACNACIKPHTIVDLPSLLRPDRVARIGGHCLCSNRAGRQMCRTEKLLPNQNPNALTCLQDGLL